MKVSQAANRINATASRLSGGYTANNGHGQYSTCYCDVLPTIRKTKSGRFSVNDSTGSASADRYDTLSEAVHGAVQWFADCCEGYSVDFEKQPKLFRFYAAVALGLPKATSKFKGF